uniref:Uncharacterized protein n=1 Tax=Setaria viridis TaxID=4556 RepID=A0A4U6UZ98_SETVI|nr:hypothetical protein SEVIR_4G170202v2 [Setaria viridis]
MPLPSLPAALRRVSRAAPPIRSAPPLARQYPLLPHQLLCLSFPLVRWHNPLVSRRRCERQALREGVGEKTYINWGRSIRFLRYHGNSAIQCQPQEVGGSSGCSPSISSP